MELMATSRGRLYLAEGARIMDGAPDGFISTIHRYQTMQELAKQHETMQLVRTRGERKQESDTLALDQQTRLTQESLESLNRQLRKEEQEAVEKYREE